MKEEQLQNHISDIHNGLTSLARLPTTRWLAEFQKARQWVKNAEAQISELLKDKESEGQILGLAQQRMAELEGRKPECDHREMEENIRNLEQLLGARSPNQKELWQELEDIYAQMELFKTIVEENYEQVVQVLKLTEGRREENEEKELQEKGNEIAWFSGADRKELGG